MNSVGIRYRLGISRLVFGESSADVVDDDVDADMSSKEHGKVRACGCCPKPTGSLSRNLPRPVTALHSTNSRQALKTGV